MCVSAEGRGIADASTYLRQLSKPSAPTFVRKKSLVTWLTGDDGRVLEAWNTGRRWVHSVKGLLDAFQCSRNWSCSEIHVVGVLKSVGHELELFDI